jgi:phosphate transport system substrate-binding protein
MSRARTVARRVLTALAATAMVVGVAPAAHATGPTILGAGSTWSAVALTQWAADVHRLGISVNYQPVGSTQGRQFFASNTVDFGVSEIPFGFDDSQPARHYAYLPIVAGGTSMMYNLHYPDGQQIRNLKLSPPTIAAIFTSRIRNWDDPKITADNGYQLPNLPIRLIVRSDGSGTSAQFSAYIAATQPAAWKAFTGKCGIPDTMTEFWPIAPCDTNAIGQKGSDGIANYVANPGLGVGAIGYLEAAYAVERNFPVVGVKNASGHYTVPTAVDVAVALTHAALHSDSTQDLSGVYTAPEKNAYPISSYSYMIVPTDSSISTDKGNVLGRFILYFACTGQQAAQKLGYSPMPKQLVQYAFAAENQIPGAPAPPPVDYAHCANPTLNGSFTTTGNPGQLPGTDLNGSGDQQQGNSNGPPPSDGGTNGPGGSTNGPGGSTNGPGGSTNGPGGTSTLPPGSSIGPDGTVYVTGTPQTIPGKRLAVLKLAADQQILGLRPPSAFPLVVLAFLILIFVFGPLVLRVRSGRRSQDLPPGPES